MIPGINQFRKLSEISDEYPLLLQAYTQWRHGFSDPLSATAGLHLQYLSLNGSYAVEPRAGLEWTLNKKQVLAAGFGLHSQMQPRVLYFFKTCTGDQCRYTNKEMGFSKSAHLVMGYNYRINSNLRLKVESYYQYLYHIPVEQRPSTYSVINYGTKFFDERHDSLVNKGSGKNYGLELTLERFQYKNYYYLFTASLFNSRYTASDGVERNTAFNGNYVFNALAGYSFDLDKGNTINLDMKAVFAGNKRYIPVDMAASEKAGREIPDYSRAYEPQYPPYFRLDGRLSWHINFKKAVNAELAFDVQNITNHKNILLQAYDPATNSMVTDYQLGLFYVFLILVQF